MNTYQRGEVIAFRKTKEAFGGLSNMAGGYPLTVGGKTWRSSEALYQAMRFPDHPDVQEDIRTSASPMGAKFVAKAHLAKTRPDWMHDSLRGIVGVRERVMAWALKVKWAQNPAFRDLLVTTGLKMIVEDSHKDPFWGAVPLPWNPDVLEGENVLGVMLVGLRALRDRDPMSLDLRPDWDRALLGGQPIIEVEGVR